MTEKKASHHSNGFVWGMIIGGGLMYLLSTPNGRKILQEISEGGIEKIEEFIDMEELANLKQTLGNQFNGGDIVDDVEKETEPVAVAHKRRRLFKGIKRK